MAMNLQEHTALASPKSYALAGVCRSSVAGARMREKIRCEGRRGAAAGWYCRLRSNKARCHGVPVTRTTHRCWQRELVRQAKTIRMIASRTPMESMARWKRLWCSQRDKSTEALEPAEQSLVVDWKSNRARGRT